MNDESESGSGRAGCCCRIGVGFPSLLLFMLLSVLSFSVVLFMASGGGFSD